MQVSYITDHGRRRLQSRAIPKHALDLVLRYGKPVHKHGAIRVYLDAHARRELVRREGQQVVRELGHKLDVFAVLGQDGVLVTAAYRTRRMRR
jgi:hypothetical protein